MRRPARTALPAVLAVPLLLGACAAPSDADDPAAAGTEQAAGLPADGALRGLGRALATGDQALLDRVTTPKADCRAALRGARAAGVTDVRLTAEDPDPGAGTVAVTLRYRSPWDSGPVVEQVAVTVGRDGRLTDCSPARRPDDTVVEPWFVDVPVVARSDRVVVLAGRRDVADRIARRVAAELPAVEEVWGGYDRTVVVYAPADVTVTRSWLGGKESDVEAAVVSLFDGPYDDAAQVGRRLTVGPGLGTDAYGALVLRHELTHVLTSELEVPVWLAEGAAEYTATRRVDGAGAVDVLGTVARRSGGAEYDGGVRLRADDAFYEDSDSGYTDAWLTCLYLADSLGEQGLVDLYSAVAEDGEGPALRAAVGTDRAGLARRVRDWVRTWQDDAPTL